jgi:hypothetical protein
VKTVARFNRREHNKSKSLEKKYKREINRCQNNFSKMSRIVDDTTQGIKEEQAEMKRLRME